MSLRSRLASASLHLFEAAGEVIPLPKRTRAQQEALRFARALQGYQLSMAIGAAAEMDLFRHLAEPRTLAEIAAYGRMPAASAQVLLDALVAAGLAVQDGAGAFSISSTGRRHFLRDAWTFGRAATDLMLGSWNHWRDLAPALRSGQGHPELKVYNPENPLMGEYVRLTTAMLAAPARELISRLDLSEAKRMICGTVGISFAAAVLKAHPEIGLTVSCLPRLIKELPAALRHFELPDPAEVIENSGEAEEDRWGSSESYDLVFLARKFAFCGPEHGVSYLRKARRVVPPGGYVVLWEPFADNFEVVPWMGAQIALVDAMLGEPHPLYRKEDVAGFAREAGYPDVQIQDVAGGGVTFVVARN